MLTITIDWKTYRWADKSTEMDWAWLTSDTIKDLIRTWVLAEEVKENKEPDSILEKLREELEKIKEIVEEAYELTMETDTGIRLSMVLDLLTSLETKEDKAWQELNKKQDAEFNGQPQFTPWQEEPKKKIEKLKIEYTLDWEKRWETMINCWTPTPWQEIEVSNDGEKWEKREFYSLDLRWYSCKKVKDNGYWLFKYSRPLKEESPEIVVPDFKAYPNKREWEIYLQDRYAEQLEILTLAVQQLSKANKK